MIARYVLRRFRCCRIGGGFSFTRDKILDNLIHSLAFSPSDFTDVLAVFVIKPHRYAFTWPILSGFLFESRFLLWYPIDDLAVIAAIAGIFVQQAIIVRFICISYWSAAVNAVVNNRIASETVGIYEYVIRIKTSFLTTSQSFLRHDPPDDLSHVRVLHVGPLLQPDPRLLVKPHRGLGSVLAVFCPPGRF